MAAIMRSLSSCLDETRMWRKTERASLEKKPSTRLSQEPWVGVKVNSKVRGLLRDPGSGLFGDLRGMIVEDQLDRGVGRIGGIEKLEEFNEFAAAVAILDQGMDLAGDEIDAGQQADRAVALIFVLACEGRMHAGLGRQVGSGRFNGLDARLLVVGDDRNLVGLLLQRSCRLFQDFHLAIDAQHFGHLFRKVGIALFQVVSHFVRLHLFLVEDFAHRALRQVGEAPMPLRRSMLASVAGQKPRRPQFVGIAKVLRLPARQRHQPCLAFECDRRLPTGARAIVERSHRAFNYGALDATLRSDDAVRATDRPQKTTDLPDRPAISTPVQFGSPAPFAIALSISISPYPHLPATIQSPAATLP